jgi:23S rRNA pseudouridine1911/1915/1917 synthase
VPKPSTKLKLGDHIIAVLPPPPSKVIPAEDIPLDVLFEDDHLIIINKRDGIIVHPARSILSGTMINALAWHFQHQSAGQLSTVGEEFARPGVVHRLDRHTTGVIVFGKSDVAHWRLAKLFERRHVDKRYLAVVHGRIEPAADVIDLPLGRHPTIKEKYAVRWDDTGKPSVTMYRVRELYDNYTLVELELKTGRTHQIRVHLSHLGWPIVGDDMYGGKALTVGDLVGPAGTEDLSPRRTVIQRQALHATLLGFRHPISSEALEFQAPLHDDMALLVSLLRKYHNPKEVNIPGATLDLAKVVAE